MSKSYGGTRVVTPTTKNKAAAKSDYKKALSGGKFDKDLSYFSEKTGASALYMHGHNYHETEIEAAKILADNGYNVVLTPENHNAYISKIDKKGNPKFVDGTVSLYTYEQSTPLPSNKTQEGLAKSINNTIQHARDKNAQIAVIYDKYNSYHREDINRGMKMFESKNKYRVKAVLTINTKGEVHEWLHDT